ncbi:MAG: hypothetical protein IJ723_06335, partial [Ruminococcus sp.]|nr:hypothetical protein [Ruminococcus sp.]
VFRKLRTGVYAPYIGDRYSADGSEPAFGGVNGWIVLAFVAAIASAFCEGGSKLLIAVLFLLLMTIRGVADDYMTDRLKKPYGVKGLAGLGWCYAVCLGYMLLAKRLGFVGSAVIFPFGIGMSDLGAMFCPVTAAVMTAEIYSFKYLDRFGIDDDSSVGGLCWAVGFVIMSGAAVMGSALDNEALLCFGAVSAAAFAGAMIWGLSPAKQRSGSSGGILVGASCAAVMGLAGFYQTAFWLMTLAAGVDAFCTLTQYLHFRRTKQLLLKGSSLHGHMRAKGLGDYAVMMIFSGLALLGAAAGVALILYGQKKFF